MGVSEAHARFGEPIEVGRRDFRLRIIATHVAIPQVVGEDDDDIRTTQVGSCEGEGGKEPAETKPEEAIHFSRTQILR